MKDDITVGDEVEIINYYQTYTNYPEWVYENVEGVSKCRYAIDKIPKNGTKGIVIATGLHKGWNDKLFYIQTYEECEGIIYEGCCYLIGFLGVKKVRD